MIESAYGEISAPVPHPAYDGFTDVITAPMFWSDEVRGVLGVGRREGRRFTARDADILEAFAGLASLALRNAEMFTQSARQARIQRGFYRIASVLGQSLSRAATLEAVAQAAAEALGGSSAAVLVPSSGRLEAVGAYELPGRPSRDPRRAGLGRARARSFALPLRDAFSSRPRSRTTSACCPTCAAARRREPLSVADLRAGGGAA